ncbi:MAG: hypothetical protein ACJAY9_000881 [Flavobacteriales bacterium]|jgi:hypothetical protein
MKTTINIGKYLMLSFLALGITVSSCKKDEEDEEELVEATFSAHTQVQVPIVLKETGELCPPCGSWGWTAWEGVISSVQGKTFLWSQYSDYFVSNSHFVNQELDPANSVNNAFQKNFPYGGSKPLFYINGAEATSSSVSAVETAVNASIASTPVDVSASYKIEWDGDNLTVTAQAKLYNNMSGNYFMGVYLVEDKATGTQSGHPSSSASLEHHMVMRGSVGGNIWGEEIIAASASSGDMIEKTFTQAVPSSYIKDNLTVGVIIWRKNGTKYFYKQAASNQTGH